jgi:hypothetical protein
MSDDWWDHAREEYEMEMATRAIEDFQAERLQSFYKEHLDLALKPIKLWKESESRFTVSEPAKTAPMATSLPES